MAGSLQHDESVVAGIWREKSNTRRCGGWRGAFIMMRAMCRVDGVKRAKRGGVAGDG
jgi:hypothetical protein